MTQRLEGKVAVITGAGSGIGAAGAALFARESASVVVVDAIADRVEQTVEAVRATGGSALGVVADVSDCEALCSVADAAIGEFGQIDILWNNAGIGGRAAVPVEMIPIEEWREVLAINLDGAFFALRAVLPHMKKRRQGAVLFTSSIAALRAYVPGRAHYTASKGALVAITRVLALELAAFNIRVNCIAPGPVTTRMSQGVQHPTEDLFELGWTPQVPLVDTDVVRRPKAEEIAQTALFLVEASAGPVTGVTLAHDGGITSF